MSIDYYLWKWKDSKHVSSGLCFLYLNEEQKHPDVAPIGDSIRDEIEIEFANETKVDEPRFQFYVNDFYICVETYGSTPIEIVYWFQDLAAHRAMVFFDPQSEDISAEDKAQFEIYCIERRVKIDAERAADDRVRWQREFPDLLAKAEGGNVAALTELGNRYSFGEGTQKNLEMAFRCYVEAAQKGNSDAMFNLAACYRQGEGVPADINAALTWYKKAMETGDLFAPFAIGEVFARGEKVPVDKSKAAEYFKIALTRGHPEARKALNELNR